MATQFEQRKSILIAADGGVSGANLKNKVSMWGWNPWQVSILISKMVKEGFLEITAGAGLKTYAHGRMFHATDAGVEWAKDPSGGDGLDAFNVHMDRAEERGGKWVILPGVVSTRQKVLLRDQGFEVGTCIRVAKADSEEKASESKGRREAR